jgi:ATP-dependent Clp protease ATP-binding subunit ClpC
MEADRLGHEYIGTEHVVLALTQDPQAVSLLTRLGVDGGAVRARIESVVSTWRRDGASKVDRPYTTRTRQSLGIAAHLAQKAGQDAVSLEQLIVGLLSERLNIGAQVLQEHGLTLDAAVAEEQRSRNDDAPSGQHEPS